MDIRTFFGSGYDRIRRIFVSMNPIRAWSLFYFVISTVLFLVGFIQSVMPTIAVVSLAIFIATFLSKRPLIIALFALPLVLLLGINTNLGRLLMKPKISGEPVFQIDSRIAGRKEGSDLKKYVYEEPVFIPKWFLEAKTKRGWNEGCMCGYTVANDGVLDDLVWYNTGRMNDDGSRPEGYSPKKDTDRVEIRLKKQSDGFAKLRIDVFQNDSRIAWYERGDIICEDARYFRGYQGQGVSTNPDYRWDQYLHENIVTHIGSRLMTNPYERYAKEANDFLEDVGAVSR